VHGGRGIEGLIFAVAREIGRQQRIAAARHKAQQREQIRQLREYERDQARLEANRRRELKSALVQQQTRQRELSKQAKEQHCYEQELKVFSLNQAIAELMGQLSSILSATLDVDDRIDFDSLRISDEPPKLTARHQSDDPIPQKHAYLERVIRPSRLALMRPSRRRAYEDDLARASSEFKRDLAMWQARRAKDAADRAAKEDEHFRAVSQFEAHRAQRDDEVDAFALAYEAGERDAIEAYIYTVLERSSYPEGFPQQFSIAFTPASKQLVVEYELPTADIIPTALEYRYVKASDAVVEKTRKPSDMRLIYQDVVAAVALRTIHEILEAEFHGHIDVVCFNGFIRTVDPATGRDIQPHLVSVRTTRETFSGIDLRRVDKRVCLRNLGANVSRQPDEAQAVKPIVEFDMVDARFVDQSDLVSALSAAVNLMDLNPWEFEELVANLFGKMGLESKLTRSSRDGGVDCVAYDSRPVLGGKVVIQAKRYRHTVGVSAVRDLYGTMMNEGANKGILVTTSGYGPDAFEFAKDKPIELIEGGGLLFLLREVGVDARIVFPAEAV
jgi:restriction system protein